MPDDPSPDLDGDRAILSGLLTPGTFLNSPLGLWRIHRWLRTKLLVGCTKSS